MSPGTVALAIITAGAPAAMALSKGSSPACWRLLHGWVVAGATSVLPDASPSPGKCFTTGTIPPASSPCRNAMPSAAATCGIEAEGPGAVGVAVVGADAVVEVQDRREVHGHAGGAHAQRDGRDEAAGSAPATSSRPSFAPTAASRPGSPCAGRPRLPHRSSRTARCRRERRRRARAGSPRGSPVRTSRRGSRRRRPPRPRR